MGPLKLAPNIAPATNIGINNQVDTRTPIVVNAPDPRGVAVPGGPTISQYSGPAQTWSVPPAPQFRPYELFGQGLHGFGSGVLRNVINSPFRMAYGALQLGNAQSAVGGDIADGGVKRGTGNLVGGFLDGPAWLVGGSELKAGIEGGFKGLSTARKIISLARGGAKAGALYGGGQGYADSASAGESAKQIAIKTAEGTAEGAGAGAVLGPAGYGAIKAAKATPDAVNLIKNLVLPNATSSKFYDAVARHVVSTGALESDAAAKSAAGIEHLSAAEGDAQAALDRRMPAGPQPKLLNPGTNFVMNNSKDVIEGSAQLVRRYAAERNNLIRSYAGDLRNPQLKTQLASLDKKYVNKHTAMVGRIDKNRPAIAEKTSPISTPERKPNVVQSEATGVTQPAPETGPIPAGLTDPTTGKTVANSSQLDRRLKRQGFPPEVSQHLNILSHEVHNQAKLNSAAARFVSEDPAAAEQVFSSGQLASTNPDGHIKLGQELIVQAAKRGDTASVNRLRAEYQSHLRTHAQTLRAAQVTDILTPRGIVSYAQKIADLKGKKLDRDQISNLEEMSKKLGKMRDGPQKTELMNAMKALAENKNLWTKGVDLGGAVVSLPRAIMASADLSFGLRQGAVLGSRMPKLWAEANAKGARFAVDPAYFKSEMGKIANLQDKTGVPLAQIFKRMGLDLEAAFGRSEEIFGNVQLAESRAAKKVGVGHIIAGSDRAFSGTAAIMRAKAAQRIINGYGGAEAVLEKWTTKDFKDLGRVINTATGRGHGGDWFEKAAPTLGKTLFSARLWKSRLDLLNPVYYARLSPAARKLALESSASFGTLAAVTLAAAAAAGATIETDMRSSDFGKIKIGNTRYDIMGGLQQNLVLAWRELTGQYKSSSTGEISDLSHPKFGGANRLTVIGRTVENKLMPTIAETLRQIQGSDISGKPFSGVGARLKDASSLLIPLNIQDTYSLGRDAMDHGDSIPKAAAKAAAGAAVPGTFGVGVQTYGPNAKQQLKSQQLNSDGTAPAQPADIAKAALSGATVNVNGKQVKWNDLSTQQKAKLAQTNQDAYDFYKKEQAMGTALGAGKVYNPSLDDQSKKVLNYFDHLTPTGKTAVLQREPGAAYALAQAKYNNDKLDGKFADPAKQAEADKTLAKSQVGSTYTQSLRDSYGMSKGDLQTLLAQGNNRSMFNDLIAYDDALYNAGLIASHKFRNKYGTITLGIGGSTGSGSGSGSSSSRTRRTSTRTSTGRKPKAVSVPHIAIRSVRTPRQRSTRIRIPRKPTVAVKSQSRGKIKVSTIKNTI